MEDYGFNYIKQDNIETANKGFHWVGHGRGSTIYFVEDDSIVIIFAEASAVEKYDVLIFGETEHINKRYYPNSGNIEDLPIEERFRIQKLLIEWIEAKGMRHDINIGK